MLVRFMYVLGICVHSRYPHLLVTCMYLGSSCPCIFFVVLYPLVWPFWEFGPFFVHLPPCPLLHQGEEGSFTLGIEVDLVA